jgi:hypothetical protein
MRARQKRDDVAIKRVSESLNLPDYRALHRLETARHESAHIIVGLLLGETIEAVSLGTSGLGGGAVLMRPRSRDANSLRRHMTVIAAGGAVDGLPMPPAGIGEVDEDQNRLRDLAIEIHGKSAKPGRVEKEIARAKTRAEKLVKKHHAEIEQLAGKLCELYAIIDGVKP